MDKNRLANSVVLKGPGIGLAYDEALSLAERARACIARGVDDCGLSNSEKLLYSVETMRLSSRIMHVLAWTMYYKAFEAGEIDRKILGSRHCRLDDEATCLTTMMDDHTHLPFWVHELMDQSAQLYRRALRLQALLDREACYASL